MIKVADFGLSESMDTRLSQDGTVKMPWMAIESLTDGIFSEKTDVVCCKAISYSLVAGVNFYCVMNFVTLYIYFVHMLHQFSWKLFFYFLLSSGPTVSHVGRCILLDRPLTQESTLWSSHDNWRPDTGWRNH